MDSKNNQYFTSLLSGDVVFDDNFCGESADNANQYSNELELSAQIPTEVRTATKKSQRKANFSVAEDILLISAYLNTGFNAITGTDRSKKCYWKQIYDYFVANQKVDYRRTQTSLSNRWCTINHDVRKFIGCHAKIQQMRQSGFTEQNKVVQAKNMYHEETGKVFVLDHCWEILKEHPKWRSDVSNKKSKSTNDASPASSLPMSLGSTNLEANNVSLNEMPLGRKASKQQLKNLKAGESSGNTQSPSSLILDQYREEMLSVEREKKEHRQKMLAYQEELLQVEKEKLCLQKLQEDERIMKIDTSSMDPGMTIFYNKLKMDIVRRSME